ncbi:MAG: TrbI/VirB10 family protein [Alphaproteobacteria bacterium]|jgi:type IV secretory pathway VirB10-like protein|nr:TrbI/VirB10 family protein [Alphaproteobacteria bacterium]
MPLNNKDNNKDNAGSIKSNVDKGHAVHIDKSSIIMLLVSIALIAVFVVGIKNNTPDNNIETPDLEEIEKKSERIVLAIEDEVEDIEIIKPYIAPSLFINNEDSIRLDNVEAGKLEQDTLSLEAAEAPLKIDSVELSSEIDSLVLNENCSGSEIFEPGEGCYISLEWTPKKTVNRNLFMIIKWKAVEANEDGVIFKENKKINISLSSFEAELEDEVIEEEEIVEEPSITESEMTVSVGPAPEKWDLNCYKFAAEAHDFTGTFLGWIQVNRNVYSPDCSKIIGILQDSGEVLEVGTGKSIGRGPSMSGKEGEDKMRSRQQIPDDSILSFSDQVSESDKEALWVEAMKNRALAKAEDPRKDMSKGADLYRADDPLDILSKVPNELNLFKAGAIRATVPVNATYLLRADKPIPAVINTAIRTSRLGTGQPVSATIERNVYGGKGRVIIIPAGTQVYGSVSGGGNDSSGTSLGGKDFTKAYDKINITWNKMIRPDGAEFNLSNTRSADAQGRMGVPGKRDTSYINDVLVTPFLTSALPAFMELAAGDDKDISQEGVGTVATIKTAKSKAVGAFKDAFMPAMEQLINQSLSNTIDPELIVPAGTRITIFVGADMSVCWSDDPDAPCWGG